MNILGNKEVGLVVDLGRDWLLHSDLLLFLIHKPHLLVVGRSKDVFVLSFLGQFWRENFTFNIHVRPDVGDRECDSLVHHLCIQIVSLHLFLFFSGH